MNLAWFGPILSILFIDVNNLRAMRSNSWLLYRLSRIEDSLVKASLLHSLEEAR
jgi:hypothetical protein